MEKHVAPGVCGVGAASLLQWGQLCLRGLRGRYSGRSSRCRVPKAQGRHWKQEGEGGRSSETLQKMSSRGRREDRGRT